ncbi:putative inactive receptor kinase [Panicum miliaceum]|uniref:Inactive receptor kinase n=1 Tax=Panicum miliaceum TaxID=4540 RepID=A0A3L6Q8X7_PANMI|nr:putative inactive receptor kinase [Panicum miliaceum]
MSPSRLLLPLLLLLLAPPAAPQPAPGSGAAPQENDLLCLRGASRVISLSLSGFGLQGALPSSLRYCRGATTLDLSGNDGQIPPALCDWLPFLVNLDLSSNKLTGPIPAELANCRFLISLKLAGNQLSGQIPASLERLDRLRSLDLSGNRLDGQIPTPLGANFPNDSFSGNSGLCGRPVSSRCGRGLGGAGLGIVSRKSTRAL